MLQTKPKPKAVPEDLRLARAIHEWYERNAATQRPWGTVTMEAMAHQIGVAFSTLNFWFLSAKGRGGGKLPKGLSITAIRAFLRANRDK